MSPYWTMASLKITRHFQHSCPSYLLRHLTLFSSPQQPQTSPSSMATVCQIPIPQCHTFILIMSYLYTYFYTYVIPLYTTHAFIGITCRCDDWLSARKLLCLKASRLCNIESKSTSGNAWPNSVPTYSNQGWFCNWRVKILL